MVTYQFDKKVYDAINRDFFKPFAKGPRGIWRALLRIKWVDVEHKIEIVYLDTKSKKLFNAFEAQLMKALNCIGCTYCQAVCPKIVVPQLKKGEMPVFSIRDDCTGCLKCCFTKKCMKLIFSNETNIWESNEQLGRLQSIKNYQKEFDERAKGQKGVLKKRGFDISEQLDEEMDDEEVVKLAEEDF